MKNSEKQGQTNAPQAKASETKAIKNNNRTNTLIF